MSEDVSRTTVRTDETSFELSNMTGDDNDKDANAPLIRHDDDDDDEFPPIPHRSGGTTSSLQSSSTSPTAFIWALTFAAGISGILFGYE